MNDPFLQEIVPPTEDLLPEETPNPEFMMHEITHDMAMQCWPGDQVYWWPEDDNKWVERTIVAVNSVGWITLMQDGAYPLCRVVDLQNVRADNRLFTNLQARQFTGHF